MTPVFLMLMFCTLTLALTRILTPAVTELYIKRRLTSRADGERPKLSDILRAFMPRSRVFSGISLPIPGKYGEEIAYGTVAVNRAGIFILCRICGDGLLENPPRSDRWKLMSCGSVTEFPNPFRELDAPRRLLAYYANAAGVSDVKVHTLLVYTDPMLRFSSPPPKGIISADVLYKRLRGISKRGSLSTKNINAISSMLREVNEGNIDAPAL